MWILGSHNSWSYLTPIKWWMKIIRFTAKCQKVDIKTQYEVYNVRCFDLRVRFNDYKLPIVAHGIVEYNINLVELLKDILWLNSKKDVSIRILLEVRNKKEYNKNNIESFKLFCSTLERRFPNIKFWCGRNLYNWNINYNFLYNPSCEEKYSSVCAPKLIDDWYPRIFAKRNNKQILKEGTDKDILLIDFVNYGY